MFAQDQLVYRRFTPPSRPTPEATLTLSIEADRRGGEATFASLVDCYRIVFGGDPWNEWKCCPGCGSTWGLDAEPALAACGYTHCGQPMEDVWPPEVVRGDIEKELAHDASCWLAMSGDTVVGFSWGYRIDSASLAGKLRVPELPLVLASACGVRSEVIYHDDVGVLPGWRGRRVAQTLVDRMVRDLLTPRAAIVVARTLANPPSNLYGWYQRRSVGTVAQYRDGSNRVVLAGPATLLLDQQRTLQPRVDREVC